MLILHLISLMAAIYTLNYYIASRIETKIHRLLPMVVGMIIIYEICQILRLSMNEVELILVAEDLLILQMAFILIHYILDFFYLKISKKAEYLLIGSVLFVGFMALNQQQYKVLYELVYGIYILSFMMSLVGIAVHIYRKRSFSEFEKIAANPLGAALVTVAFSLPFRKAAFLPGRELVTIFFIMTSGVAYFLMRENHLEDDATLMQSNMFDVAEIGIVFFDRSFFVLKANEMARKNFPEALDKAQRSDLSVSDRLWIQGFVDSGRREGEFQQNGKYYRCMLEEFYYAGMHRGYVLTIVDNNEQKQKVMDLEYQSMLKSKFLANMSHDFRSPIHAIIGASNILMSKNNLTASNRGYVQMIQKSSKVLLGLVNEILLHSKLSAGKVELAKESYSFEAMFKELAQIMILNLKNTEVDFTLEFTNDYPVQVVGDELRVREILQNIISNAVKFTEEGSIRCRVACDPDKEVPRVRFVCEIADTGSGMSEEQLKNLFDEYASYANLKRKEGTGLGMNIVKQLSNLMEGDVWAESDGKTGSTITVTFYQDIAEENWNLPVRFEKEILMRRSAKMEMVEQPGIRFEGAKVLVVDDIEINRVVFKDMAERWNVYPDTADSGEKALEMAQNKAYHIIFLDYMMPGLDGMETAEKIKEFTDTPLVLLTADASEETKRKALEAGFVDYMSKPIDTKQLEGDLEKYVPKEYQRTIEQGAVQTEQGPSEASLLAQRKILETIEAELVQLSGKLPEYFETDLAMFRIKVHGIKGFTKQIHKYGISRQAEIMEMAAKADHRNYIKENLFEFLEEIKAAIEEVRDELSKLPKPQVVLNEDSIDELLAQLKEAFDEFDLMSAEKHIEQLKNRNLSEEEKELLQKLEEAFDDIDYEAGSSILEEYLTK